MPRSPFFILTIALLAHWPLAAQVPADRTAESSEVAVEEQKSPDEPASDSAPTPTPSPGAPADGSQPPATLEQMMAEMPEEYRKELASRVAVFQAARQKLEIALGDQRETFIRYVNKENRSQNPKETYFQQRQKVRELLDEMYLAALDVIRAGFDEDAVQFAMTMIQHRFKHDIYDEVTLEGAARLIDGGSNLTYLYQAAARSAVATGKFEMAKQLLDSIDDEQMEEVDLGLEFNLDRYKEMYEAEQPIREKEAIRDDLPRVLLKTTQGDVLIELFLDQAPSTVSHFIGLVEEGFYDGLDFYQVIDHLIALTGDPSGVGSGDCGKFLIDEHDREDARKGLRGSLVMAKLPTAEQGEFVPHTASSQFAILFLPIFSVTEQQTVFGRVLEGMDAVSRLRRVDPHKKKKKGQMVLPPDRIIEATVIRRPETLPEPNYVVFPGR